MKRKKQGYCQYPDCGIDLGMVPVATKFCQPHEAINRQRKLYEYRRERYKSKFHRERIMGGVYKKPKSIPKGLKEGGSCPGNDNGFCGAILRRERVMNAQGYSTPFFDYVCGTHRFPDPREEKD